MHTYRPGIVYLLLRPLFTALREALKARRQPTRYEVWNV